MEPMLPSFPLEETPWICSFLSHVQSCHQLASQAVVAEWLRRLTRNQFPSGSVGSNPTDCELFSPQPCACTHSVPLSCSSCLDGPGVQQHRWFSGRMLACHAGGPGSIPGRCKSLLSNQPKEVAAILIVGKSFGGAGYRSRYLSHAKRALYHLSYAPLPECTPAIWLTGSL